jgi:hypothetical protein
VASVGLISFVYGRPHYGSDRLRAARRLSHRARSRRRGVTNQYARENLTGKGIVVLVVLADDSEEEKLLLVSYLICVLIIIESLIDVNRGKCHTY